MKRSSRTAFLAALLLAAPAASLGAQVSQSEYAARRAALAAKMGDGIMLALGAGEPAMNFINFFQGETFAWLTGIEEPDAALLITKKGNDVKSTIFVLPRDPAREVWTGNRLGSQRVAKLMSVEARDADQLRPTLDSALKAGATLHLATEVTEARSPESHESLYINALKTAYPQTQVVDLARNIRELRGKKSPAELEYLRKAIAITVDAHKEAMRAIEPGMNEFEIQGLVEYTFRRNGADRPGFGSIVGSGPNSTTLHYNRNDRFMNAGEVVVMDIGAAYRGYSANVTRTVPISGTFSKEQREIYQIVRDAQAAAERQAKIGNPLRLMSDSASAVLAAGLARLGLIESATATYEAGNGRKVAQLSLYYMHGLGHGIGLNVHDPDQYSGGAGGGTIQPGSAFSIEPGIYVRANLIDDVIPKSPANGAFLDRLRPTLERYKNIGVRIEDDYLVTETAVEWTSRAPREIDEIEALMKERFAGPAARDPQKVGWYRQMTAPLP